MLELQGVNAYYGNLLALRGVSLRVRARSIVAIIGANGAGKTTLLQSISGLIESKDGRILYEGQDIGSLPPHRIVGLGICQVPEGRQIFSHLTVKDNLMLGAYLYSKKRDRLKTRQTMEDVLQIFPVLRERGKQIAGTLSGGEQQMLAIGRALMSHPRLLLLDEPSMGLAPMVVREIFGVIRNLHERRTTILLVEQNARASLKIADHGYVLETGEIVLEGRATELVADEKVKQAYLGGLTVEEKKARCLRPRPLEKVSPRWAWSNAMPMMLKRE
jgi:branched-chain amino acid transport system ATP-binding protein